MNYTNGSKMRVIGGKYRGSKIYPPNTLATRPTSDRVKETMFNLIENHHRPVFVLDLFAGSGALGIEALSRGAKSCVFIEQNFLAYRTIVENIKRIRITEIAKVEKLNSLKFLLNTKEKFDTVILDPPYNKGLLSSSVLEILKGDVLLDNGILAVESADEQIKNDKLLCMKTRKCMKSNVFIYKKINT